MNIVNQSVNKYALRCLNQLVARAEKLKCKSLVKKEPRAEQYLVDKRFNICKCELIEISEGTKCQEKLILLLWKYMLGEVYSVQICSQQHLQTVVNCK